MVTTRLLAALALCVLVSAHAETLPTSVQPSTPVKLSETAKRGKESSPATSPAPVKEPTQAKPPATTVSEASKTVKPAVSAKLPPAPPSIFQGGQGGTSLQLRLGVGCILSNYSALPVVAAPTGSENDSSPSFRFALVPGFGVGEYATHFSAFQLPPEDVVVVRGLDDGNSATSAGSSVALAGSDSSGGFYTSTVTGTGVEVSLYRTSATPPPPTQTARGTACYGFQMDEIQFRALESASEDVGSLDSASASEASEAQEDQAASETVGATTTRAPTRSHADESVCGQDESVEAVCAPSLAMRNASQGVARLTIIKDNNMDVAYCTGFLLGCEGHLITNQHCIGSWVDALNTLVEFHAESPACGENCTSRAACPGNVIVRSTTLVAVSEELDYALVSLVNDTDSALAVQAARPLLEAVGGYLQVRESGPVDKEEVYVAQHPMGYGKQIASTHNGQPGRIESLEVDACRVGDVGYYIDTQQGSSGSPVIAVSDNAVVALHHCGGCLNGGIPSEALIADLKAKGVLPACAVRDV